LLYAQRIDARAAPTLHRLTGTAAFNNWSNNTRTISAVAAGAAL